MSQLRKHHSLTIRPVGRFAVLGTFLTARSWGSVYAPPQALRYHLLRRFGGNILLHGLRHFVRFTDCPLLLVEMGQSRKYCENQRPGTDTRSKTQVPRGLSVLCCFRFRHVNVRIVVGASVFRSRSTNSRHQPGNVALCFRAVFVENGGFPPSRQLQAWLPWL